MKLYLIRHAQSANNADFSGDDNSAQRSFDPKITETGHQQAKHLAKLLAHPASEALQQPFHHGGKAQGFGLTHLYCSLMTRSIQTAEYIARDCELPLVAHTHIWEKNGLYEYNESGVPISVAGPGRDYFVQQFPELQLPDELGDEGWHKQPVETDAEFMQRVRIALKDIEARHIGTDCSIGLVAHGEFIDECLNVLMKVQPAEVQNGERWEANWTFHNTSISRIDYVAGKPMTVYLNRLDHLPTELITW